MNDHYSQYGEDLIVLGILGDGPGRMLEIGAWHPTQMSNSRLLIERGWDAVLVEFSPCAVHNLVKEYGESEKVSLVQAAVVTCDGGNLERFRITDDALSTSSEQAYEKWKEVGGFFGHMWVPQISLHNLILQFGKFDFVSFDAEGTSVDLAINYVRNLRETPRVMCVEHDDRIVELTSITQQFGYKVEHVNGTNVILARAA